MRKKHTRKPGTKLSTRAPSTRHALIGHQGGVRRKPLKNAGAGIPVLSSMKGRKKKSMTDQMEDADMPV
jgi:hypothetical protein